MRNRKQYVRKAIACMLSVLFCVYYTDITMFTHAHIVNDTYIVHSHFHTPTHHSTPDGTHSTQQIHFLKFHQSEFLLFLGGLLAVAALIRPLLYNVLSACITPRALCPIRTFSLCAPPVY